MTRNEIDCPRAKTWMTPCIARDGNTALADPPKPVCVGCGEDPHRLLSNLTERYPQAGTHRPATADAAADRLAECVAAYVGAGT